LKASTNTASLFHSWRRCWWQRYRLSTRSWTSSERGCRDRVITSCWSSWW